ncbi:hypothetical protein PanWU01x14_178670 [Parasponia andersonii]|uniref:Uncharacterized protein n=1 Tax=Parasponia andersonii TaxID=3476 RepID=A0A2P5C753_PARAD|nr:hypothetical protein PanWU01x14_178670 [Parasponia andersonii]
MLNWCRNAKSSRELALRYHFHGTVAPLHDAAAPLPRHCGTCHSFDRLGATAPNLVSKCQKCKHIAEFQDCSCATPRCRSTTSTALWHGDINIVTLQCPVYGVAVPSSG